MDQLTLTLQDQGHQEQGRLWDQGRRRHPECLHRQGCSGRRSTRHASGGHIPAGSLGSLLDWGTTMGRRTGAAEVKRTAGATG